MPKHVNQFLLREKYEKWLLENGVKSLGAYYPQDKFDRIDTDLLFLDLIGIFAYQKEYYIEYENLDNLRYLFYSDMVSYFQKKND